MPEAGSFYRELENAMERPEPFQYCNAERLWTDEHISAKMLEYHLDPDISLASRTEDFIESSAEWISERFDIGKGVAVADFGCGPGLYASRFAALGAEVTGVDFSWRSLDYARRAAQASGLRIDYILADYLEFDTDKRFDLIALIFCDLCALGPDQRAALLGKFREFLKPEGSVLLDVCSFTAFKQWAGSDLLERRLMNGFWAPDDYFGIRASFKYEQERVTLDKYTIVQPHQSWQVFNWLQYFSVETLRHELEAAGLRIAETYSDVAGTPYKSSAEQFAVAATAKRF